MTTSKVTIISSWRPARAGRFAGPVRPRSQSGTATPGSAARGARCRDGSVRCATCRSPAAPPTAPAPAGSAWRRSAARPAPSATGTGSTAAGSLQQPACSPAPPVAESVSLGRRRRSAAGQQQQPSCPASRVREVGVRVLDRAGHRPPGEVGLVVLQRGRDRQVVRVPERVPGRGRDLLGQRSRSPPARCVAAGAGRASSCA